MDKFKLPIGLSFLGLVLIVGGIFASGLNTKPKSGQDFPKESLVQNQKISFGTDTRKLKEFIVFDNDFSKSNLQRLF